MDRSWLAALVERQPDATLVELREALGIDRSISAIRMALQKLIFIDEAWCKTNMTPNACSTRSPQPMRSAASATAVTSFEMIEDATELAALGVRFSVAAAHRRKFASA